LPAWSPSGTLFEVGKKKQAIAGIEEKMAGAGFWDNPEAAQGLVAELKSLKGVVESYAALRQDLEDEIGMLEMCDDARDTEHILQTRSKLGPLERRLEAVEVQALFTGRNDSRNVYLAIHAGTGGVDAMDWAQILQRMYARWLQANGYEIELTDELPGEEAGIKKAVYEVRGRYAFGYLKSEIGVHRLIRLSPFDANHRRQTSFASVDVTPVFDDVAIDIKEADLRVDTYSAGGPGGQHVNKTQSAVRITHLPTGVVASCQTQRSQQMNRKHAMRNLASKLYQLEEAKREKEFAKMYGEKGEISFGSQIRSYTMQPYTLVKDERTGQQTGNIQKVLDGDLDPFIEAFLRWKDRKY
jgi:peptide chain release factor 2